MKKRVITFIVFIALIVSVVSVVNLVNKGSPIQLSPSDGLLSYYPFEGNFKDFNTNREPINFGTTLVDGRIGKTASFDGDDYLIVSDSKTETLDSFTLSAWIYKEEGIANYDRVLGKYYWTSTNPKGFAIDIETEANNRARCYIQDSTSTISALYYDVGSIPKQEWHHLVCTYDSIQGKLAIYLDGEFIRSKTQAVNGYNNDYPIMIGATGDGVLLNDNYRRQNMFNGKIDEVLIYNRALSKEEVKNIYEEPNFISTPSILSSLTGLPEGFSPTAGYYNPFGDGVIGLWQGNEYYTSEDGLNFQKYFNPIGTLGLPISFIPDVVYTHDIGGNFLGLWDNSQASGSKYYGWNGAGKSFKINLNGIPAEDNIILGYWHKFGGVGRVTLFNDKGDAYLWDSSEGTISKLTDLGSFGLPTDRIPTVAYYYNFDGMERVDIWYGRDLYRSSATPQGFSGDFVKVESITGISGIPKVGYWDQKRNKIVV